MKESAEQPTASSAKKTLPPGIPIANGPLIPPRPRPEPPIRERSNGPAGWALVAVCSVAILYGAVAGVRRIAAELLIERGGRDQFELAAKLAPGNSLAWERLAALETDGADAHYRTAELRPGDAVPWVDLALELERRRDFDKAEEALHYAESIDPGFLPRWTLANFYLRQGREDEFWSAIQSAIAADHTQTPMAAALCRRAFDDPALILERAVPDDPESLRAYLRYLIREGDLEALQPVWARYEANVSEADLPALTNLLDDLLFAGEVDLAISIWNRLIDAALLDYRPLAVPGGPYLTNPNFATRVAGIGFDWRVTPAAGVTRFQRLNQGRERTIEIRLSGGQPEYTLLLTQIVPVPADSELVFTYEYATQQLPFLTGIGWRIRDHLSERILAESDSAEAAEDYWNTQQMLFRTPEETRLLRVELQYERAPGTDRYRGSFVLRTLDLQRADGEAAN